MYQVDFFKEDKEVSDFLSIRDAANIINVSEASIRNWIKTKYLSYDKKNGITLDSFNLFLQNIAGVEKLNKRANKSLVDSHNHNEIIQGIMEIINAPDISERYQNSLSIAYRNKEGIYYTPENICEQMFSDVPAPDSRKTFFDPCCGSGNFIIQAVDFGFSVENVYGFDIDPVAVQIARQRLFNKTGYWSDKIRCVDFLEIASEIHYDYILTNPPWGKKFDKQKKICHQRNLGVKSSTDSSALFFIKALNFLKTDGFLSFLVSDAFFKISIFSEARKRLLDYTLISIRDFNNPFKGIQAKAQSFCIQKKNSYTNTLIYNDAKICFERRQESFIKNPSCIINFLVDSNDAEVIDAIYNKPSIRLKDKAQWGLGIVTGNNKKFCSSEMGNDLMPVYRGMDIHVGYLSEPINFIPKDLSLYQQVPPVHLFTAQEKIVYRFISSDLVFYHDKKQCYFLNSANMLMPHDDFPVSMESLVWLFNTKLYNWLFRCVFNTNKILRTDLEKMPIPTNFLERGILSESGLLEYFSIVELENGTYRIKK